MANKKTILCVSWYGQYGHQSAPINTHLQSNKLYDAIATKEGFHLCQYG